MFSNIRIVTTAVACTFAVMAPVLFSAAAQARSIPAYSSFKLDEPANNSCMLDFYGEVFNQCSATQRLSFPITMDGNAGPKSLSVTSTGAPLPSTGGTVCNIWSIAPSAYSQLGLLTFTTGGQTLKANFSVGKNSTVLLFCDVPVSAGIATVTWTP